MANFKTARATFAGSIVGAAVAAALFSAGPAAAKPTIDIPNIDFGPTATALHNTPVTDGPGGPNWIATLFGGQRVFLSDDCNPSKYCKVVSARIDAPNHTGWVDGAALRRDHS